MRTNLSIKLRIKKLHTFQTTTTSVVLSSRTYTARRQGNTEDDELIAIIAWSRNFASKLANFTNYALHFKSCN